MLLLAFFSFSASGAEASAKEPEKATFAVSGYGFIGNRELKRMLNLLEIGGKQPAFFDPNFVEDSVLILISRLKRDGYLEPTITTRLTLADGTTRDYHWTGAIAEPLPRPMQIKKVDFRIKKGVLYYFKDVQFEGLQSVPEKRARGFFVATGVLIPLKKSRIFTQERLDRGMQSLTQTLNRQGYEDAEVRAAELRRNDRTGEVDVAFAVTEGPKSIVRSLREETFVGTGKQGSQLPDIVTTNYVSKPFSQLWLQDYMQAARTANFVRGYPDVSVDVTTLAREPVDNLVKVDLLSEISTGPKIWVGEVKIEGAQKTKESILQDRISLESGDLLDRTAAEQGRFRLARLGIFDSVELTYEVVNEKTRNVVYRVHEGRQMDFSLLFGLGSYEIVWAGFEWEQYNVFGRAHRSRLRAVQSFKSSLVDYRYTMPSLLGEDVDVFFNASGLRREEISFVREELGGGVGGRKYFEQISSDLSVRYSYQVLNAADNEFTPAEGLRRADVGAIIADLRHDRRDNPLYPRMGYKVFTTVEVASKYLASQVNYQRLEIATSYHRPLDEGRWIHFGLSHGAVFTANGSEMDLPFNKRFFPGGKNSIRGYQEGEAAPRDANGQVVGAETYVFGSVEFEQALTPSLAAVAFVDSVGFSQTLRGYPAEQFLVSVGGGLRWKTIVGPIRVEYGYNLNPRPEDPVGTVQFSLGFPF